MFSTLGSKRKKTNNKNSNRCQDRALRLDLFARPVGLTFKGQHKYRTTLGAVVSLIAILFVFLYAGLRALPILTDDKTKINQNTMLITENNAVI